MAGAVGLTHLFDFGAVDGPNITSTNDNHHHRRRRREDEIDGRKLPSIELSLIDVLFVGHLSRPAARPDAISARYVAPNAIQTFSDRRILRSFNKTDPSDAVFSFTVILQISRSFDTNIHLFCS